MRGFPHERSDPVLQDLPLLHEPAIISETPPCRRLGVVTGAPTRILFSLRRPRGSFETHRVQERIQVVTDALIKAVNLTPFLFGQDAVAAKWRQQARREGRIDLLEELKEHYADRVALADQLIATGARNFFDQAFAAQLGEVVAERCQRVLRFGLAKSIQGRAIEIR